MPDKSAQSDQAPDRRNKYRSKDLDNPMVVISLSGRPLYQLKSETYPMKVLVSL